MAKQLLSAAKNWSGAGPIIDTYIPDITDSANIEDAFKLFMYGETVDGGSEYVQETSLYSSIVAIKETADGASGLVSSHNSASINVHGLSSGAAVVGTTSTQTLTNKTLENPIVSGSVTVSGNVIGHISIANSSASAYTVSLSDDGGLVQMSSASVNSLIVPLNSSQAFPIGTQITVVQAGTGQTTISPASGSVTLNSTPGLKLRARWSTATLVKLDTDSWLVTGDLTA